MRGSAHLVSAVAVDLRGVPYGNGWLTGAKEAVDRFHSRHNAHPAAILMTEEQRVSFARLALAPSESTMKLEGGRVRAATLWGYPIWVDRSLG